MTRENTYPVKTREGTNEVSVVIQSAVMYGHKMSSFPSPNHLLCASGVVVKCVCCCNGG